MKLMTKELERRFAQIGSQEDKGDDAIVVCKFFTPDSGWTWWATEYSNETREFFGLVQGFEVEFGYFALEELETATGPLGLRIERDLHWKERTIGEIRASLASVVRP
jgi:hypothetical protein